MHSAETTLQILFFSQAGKTSNDTCRWLWMAAAALEATCWSTQTFVYNTLLLSYDVRYVRSAKWISY